MTGNLIYYLKNIWTEEILTKLIIINLFKMLIDIMKMQNLFQRPMLIVLLISKNNQDLIKPVLEVKSPKI